MSDLLKSVDKVLGPDGHIVDAPKPAPEPLVLNIPKVPKTLGEIVAEVDKAAKAAPPPADPNAVPAPAPAAPAPPAPAPAPAAAPAPRLQRKVTPPAPLAVPPPPAPAPAPVVTPPPPAPDPEAALLATLDDDQRAELEIAAIAETKFPELKGKRQETLQYFKKVEDFASKNPNASQEELDTFINSNKPKWKSAIQKRKAEALYFAGDEINQRVEQVRAELQPRLNEANQRIRNQELQPHIDRQMHDLAAVMTSADSLPDANTMEAIPQEVAQRINDVGYEAALKEFRVEAPIFQGASNAWRTYLNLANGLVARNPADPVQNFVINFVQHQGQIHASKPASETTVNGRQFLPLAQYNQALAQNPANANAYYTFSDQDVRDLLAINANIQYNNELKSLEQSGFTRAKRGKVVATPNPAAPASPQPPVVSTPPANVPPASPKVRSSPPPSPAPTVKPMTESARLMESLLPGSAQRLGQT
jgi:hypothetical protein